MSLRVLQIANQPGPLRLFMLPLCDRLRQAGATVELACMRMGANFQPLAEAGFPLHPLPPGRWADPRTPVRLYRAVRALLRRQRYDLMVVHTPVMSWIARCAARDCVGAVAYMAHGLGFAPQQPPPLRWLLRRLEQWAGQWTDLLMVMNEVDAAACRRYRLVRPDGRWVKVPGVGVDVARFARGPSPAEQAAVADRLGLREGKPLVLYLGRFIQTKRPGDLLELARRVGDAAEFVLAGEGPLWRAIAAQACALGRHVHVLGWTEDIDALLARCAVVAFPSVYIEGLPRLLLEAQAAGKPAVAYDVRGSSDAIADGQTGLLVPPADVEGFCRAVMGLLDAPARRQAMGQAGQARVAEQFSLDASIGAQLDALGRMLRAKSLPVPW